MSEKDEQFERDLREFISLSREEMRRHLAGGLPKDAVLRIWARKVGLELNEAKDGFVRIKE